MQGHTDEPWNGIHGMERFVDKRSSVMLPLNDWFGNSINFPIMFLYSCRDVIRNWILKSTVIGWGCLIDSYLPRNGQGLRNGYLNRSYCIWNVLTCSTMRIIIFRLLFGVIVVVLFFPDVSNISFAGLSLAVRQGLSTL